MSYIFIPQICNPSGGNRKEKNLSQVLISAVEEAVRYRWTLGVVGMGVEFWTTPEIRGQLGQE